MDRVRFIEHRGHKVLLIDYSGLTDEREIIPVIERRKLLVSEQAPGSLLTLADVTGVRFSRNVVERIKQATVLDLPFVKRAAAVGDTDPDPVSKTQTEAVETFSRRKWATFNTREEALDWLVSEAAP